MESLFRRWTKRCLLIIDDYPADAELLGIFANRLRYKFDIAPNAEIALALMNQKRYRAVFVDVRLTGMSGFEFVDAVRKQNHGIPVTIICGLTDDLINLPRGRRFSFIAKPVSLEAIEDSL